LNSGPEAFAESVIGGSASLPVKAAPKPGAIRSQNDAWNGFYAGLHFGAAGGQAGWEATGPGGPGAALSGSIGLFNAFDPSKGTGSYFAGLQGGYNYRLGSGRMFGMEADVTFPSRIGGSQPMVAPSIGRAEFADTVQMFGTLRARAGVVVDHWLYYATGGLAWTYDSLSRTQTAGAPQAGTAVPGTIEQAFKLRTGWAAGAGVELPVAPGWNAKFEYLFAGFAHHPAIFALGAQTIDSGLSLHMLKAGLNYRLGTTPESFKLPDGIDADRWSFHGQSTFLQQYAFPFRSPYRGLNSLIPNEGRETFDITLYAGFRLWSGAELWVNPEINQGFGLSGTLGIAGFSSGEAYKVGASVPYARMTRYFVRQTIDLPGETDKVQGEINQFNGSRSSNRLVFTVGKFGVADVFDTLNTAHDARRDFMNWSVIDQGSFDYAADAFGFTYGATAEWYQGDWTFRGGLFDMSIVPNSVQLDPTFKQFQWVGEIEHRHKLWGQPGQINVTAFLSRARMGKFDDAILLAQAMGGLPDIAAVRHYDSRSGIHVGVEQQFMTGVTTFARAGLADGKFESYEFTDIDRTVSAGLTVSGQHWGRPDDKLGFAGVVNSISDSHKAFLNAGGLGILVGDGKLPNPGAEKIIEMYYAFPVGFLRMTLDYQLVTNPGYNRDRGPASIIGTRLRAQF
jgi:high affinity Mn2+ porin